MFKELPLIGKGQYIVWVTIVALFLFIVFIWSKYEQGALPLPPADAAYKNPELSNDERIEDLLSYMTLEEKVGQMALVEKNSIEDLKDIGRYGIGALLSGAGAKPEENTIEGWQDMVRTFDEASRASRLGIPALYGVDANHGHSNVPGATIFPHLVGLGATGDVELVREVARATGEELLATGIYWSYSPTLDLPEDIRWGRVYETFSNDPVLAGRLGVAYLDGLQNPNDSSQRIAVLATPKHYVGAGGMLWNTSSNQLFQIDQGTTPPIELKLRNAYLPPFEDAIDAGALSIMTGLNSWGDTKLSASEYLINDVLKGELGFEGFVVSDWYGVYEIPGGDYTAAVTAINAGIDMVMLPYDYKPFTRNMISAVGRGEIQESRIDDAVRRILKAKFALGLFERDTEDASAEVIGSQTHRALAREAVAKSLVLLKNEGNILPIRNDVDHIRITGSAADNVGRQAGAWTFEWQGIDGNWLSGATSILSGIREVAKENVRIEYDMNGFFAESEPRADLGIAIVGEAPYAEGHGDNADPSLSVEDVATIARLKEASDRVVVVLVTGRPLLIADQQDGWDALMVAWLPGSEGAGVADVLFGAVPATGKLPLPWPSSLTQLPISTTGATRDGTAVLFPRNFGLSYNR